MIEIDKLKAQLPAMSIASIAGVVKTEWQKVNFAAVPYLDAMRSMDRVTDNFGADPGPMIVNYFLGNSQTWRGEVAREVKAELKKRVKQAYEK